MITVRDQLGDIIALNGPARKIVSVVPSQTELLHYFGLEESVVGISKFCIHPKHWHQNKNRVGGTKTIDIDKVKSLSPDLIIGNKEENTESNINALREIAPVWMSDVNTLEEALDMIGSIGELTGKDDEASQLNKLIQQEFKRLETIQIVNGGKSVLYYIWKDPYYVAGQSTFINSMLQACGLSNATELDRYPEINENDVEPDYVFLSSEPYPFKNEDAERFRLRFPDAEVKLVDGEMFSWYGSKLLEAPTYFNELLK